MNSWIREEVAKPRYFDHVSEEITRETQVIHPRAGEDRPLDLAA